MSMFCTTYVITLPELFYVDFLLTTTKSHVPLKYADQKLMGRNQHSTIFAPHQNDALTLFHTNVSLKL